MGTVFRVLKSPLKVAIDLAVEPLVKNKIEFLYELSISVCQNATPDLFDFSNRVGRAKMQKKKKLSKNTREKPAQTQVTA